MYPPVGANIPGQGIGVATQQLRELPVRQNVGDDFVVELDEAGGFLEEAERLRARGRLPAVGLDR